jgi:DNA-binding CsgD family transcriptional regulator
MNTQISLELQILDALGLPIAAKNEKGVYVYANQEISDLLRVPKLKIIGKTVHDLAPGAQAEHCEKDDLELFATGVEQTHTIFVEANNFTGVVRFSRRRIISEEGAFIIEIGWVVSKASRKSFPKLSKRELEILMLISQGQSTKQLAQTLKVSPHTANDHLKSIYKKLDVHTKTQAIQKVIGLEVVLRD